MKFKLSGSTKIPKRKAATYNFKVFETKDIHDVIEYVNTHSILPCKVRGGHRRKENVEKIYPWIRLDVDQEGEAEEIDKVLKSQNLYYIKKPSTSHAKYPYKWHYLIPIKNVSQDYDTYKLQYQAFLDSLGIKLKDKSLASVVQNMNPYGIEGASLSELQEGTVWEAPKIQKSTKRSRATSGHKGHSNISRKELKKLLSKIEPSC